MRKEAHSAQGVRDQGTGDLGSYLVAPRGGSTLARCVGEHLECSPCGEFACEELCLRLAVPGGAAVALASRESDYTLKVTNLPF